MPTNANKQKTPKSRTGRFPKGTSGNPAGRPRGSRNQATLLVENLLQGEAEKLTRKAIEIALAGDPMALRLCLDRLLPLRKDRLIDLRLGPVETLPQIRTGMSTVLQAMGNGGITPTEGETVANVLSMQSNVVSAADLVPRMAQIEEQVAALKNTKACQGPADVVEQLRTGRDLQAVEHDS